MPARTARCTTSAASASRPAHASVVARRDHTLPRCGLSASAARKAPSLRAGVRVRVLWHEARGGAETAGRLARGGGRVGARESAEVQQIAQVVVHGARSDAERERAAQRVDGLVTRLRGREAGVRLRAARVGSDRVGVGAPGVGGPTERGQRQPEVAPVPAVLWLERYGRPRELRNRAASSRRQIGQRPTRGERRAKADVQRCRARSELERTTKGRPRRARPLLLQQQRRQVAVRVQEARMQRDRLPPKGYRLTGVAG
eukprot:2821588-Prymnesium_polylepis.3